MGMGVYHALRKAWLGITLCVALGFLSQFWVGLALMPYVVYTGYIALQNEDGPIGFVKRLVMGFVPAVRRNWLHFLYAALLVVGGRTIVGTEGGFMAFLTILLSALVTGMANVYILQLAVAAPQSVYRTFYRAFLLVAGKLHKTLAACAAIMAVSYLVETTLPMFPNAFDGVAVLVYYFLFRNDVDRQAAQ